MRCYFCDALPLRCDKMRLNAVFVMPFCCDEMLGFVALPLCCDEMLVFVALSLCCDEMLVFVALSLCCDEMLLNAVFE